MEIKKYVYWQDGEMWLGYLEEYPDYMTQGESLEELKENLKDFSALFMGNGLRLTDNPSRNLRKISDLLSGCIQQLFSDISEECHTGAQRRRRIKKRHVEMFFTRGLQIVIFPDQRLFKERGGYNHRCRWSRCDGC